MKIRKDGDGKIMREAVEEIEEYREEEEPEEGCTTTTHHLKTR